MDDLRRRFADLDELRAPDLWADIEQRAAAAPVTGRITRVPTTAPSWSPGLNRSLVLGLAVAGLVVALVAGAIATGSRLVRPPDVVTQPSPVVANVSQAPTPDDSMTLPPASGLVAWTVLERVGDSTCFMPEIRCTAHHLWIANGDGSDAREIVPSMAGSVVGWTPDGARLLHTTASSPVVANGVKTDETSGGGVELMRPDGSTDRVLAPEDALCQPRCTDLEGYGLSPDGRQLAYVATRSPQAGTTSVIALMDLASGKATELRSTATTNAGDFCDTAADQGTNDVPRWSPDGTHLVFARQVIGPPGASGLCGAALFTVAADGSDLHQLTTPGLYALMPVWSPDGTRIAFHDDRLHKRVGSTDLSSTTDIYTIGADGTDLRRLTSDSVSAWPQWTRDGRVVFIRWTDSAQSAWEGWIMDADGGNTTRLPGSLAGLTAAGCVTCPYPEGQKLSWAFWQPAR